MGIMIFDTALASNVGEWWDQNINKVAYKLGVEHTEDEYEEDDFIYWSDLSTTPAKRYDQPPKVDLLKIISSDVLSILPLEENL
jgi:hypothetical protein